MRTESQSAFCAKPLACEGRFILDEGAIMACNFSCFLMHARGSMTGKVSRTLLTLALLTLVFLSSSVAQTGGGHQLYGDFRIDESKVTGPKPLSFDLILYNGGRRVGRQTVVNNSHYRFMHLVNGDYE